MDFKASQPVTDNHCTLYQLLILYPDHLLLATENIIINGIELAHLRWKWKETWKPTSEECHGTLLGQ